MDELNIIIDESGTMGNNISNPSYRWTKYFVISGYIVDKTGLSILNSTYLKEELKIRQGNPKYYNNIKEIKGINIIHKDCAILLRTIIDNVSTFIPFSIIVCKEHVYRKIWNENGAFNYFLKVLINFLKENNLLTSNKINIYLDNRGRKTPFRNELVEYLEQDLYLDMIEKDSTVKIQYKDSKHYAYIRCADLIAYSNLKLHENRSRRDRKFINNLKTYKINIIQNKTVFPEGTCKINNCSVLKVR